jgi:hypothetical protein
MTTFAGIEEVTVFQAITTKHGIKMMKLGMRPNRGWTMTKALAAAGRIVGKTYKRTEADAAVADLDAWVRAQRGA